MRERCSHKDNKVVQVESLLCWVVVPVVFTHVQQEVLAILLPVIIFPPWFIPDYCGYVMS